MSSVPRNSRELIQRQIDEMGSIRNANPRDPQFKQWRQNTLTVIQRIWVGDTTRSERFRRVPFTPPQIKHDARAARQYFERGCGEALQLLGQLMRQLDDPATAPAAPAIDRVAEDDIFEGDSPPLELGGSGAPPAPPVAVPPPARERSAGPPRVPGLSETPAPASASIPFEVTPNIAPDEPGITAEPPVAAEPPAAPNRVSVRGPGARDAEVAPGAQVNPLRDILSDVKAPASESRRRGKKGNGRQRLKDMLGLNDLDRGTRAGSTPSRPEPAPRPAPAPAPIQPAAARPPAPPPAEFVLPEFQVPPEPPLSLTPADLDDAVIAAAPPPPPVAPVASAPPSAPPSPPGTPEPAAEDDAARVTAEFLLNSPVLSSQPRPVARRPADPAPPPRERSLREADTAAMLMQIASEVDALGVPAGQRAWARASLMDLSRLVETGDISWDSLRDAVQFAMQFPPLARRVLPLLLPFLDAAA